MFIISAKMLFALLAVEIILGMAIIDTVSNFAPYNCDTSGWTRSDYVRHADETHERIFIPFINSRLNMLFVAFVACICFAPSPFTASRDTMTLVVISVAIVEAVTFFQFWINQGIWDA